MLMKNTKGMKQLKIEPKGSVNRCNSESGRAGECSVLMNMRESNDALIAVGRWNVLGQVLTGEKLLLVDTRNGVDYYLTSIGSDIYLHGMKQGKKYEQCNEVLCCLDAEPVWAQSVGGFVVISTQLGRRYLYYKDSTYVLLNIEDAIPHLTPDSINENPISVTVVGKRFENVYNQWTGLKDDDKCQLRDSVLSAYNSMLKQSNRRGTFIQPVVVRYALKLWDGNYAWVSAPVVVGKGVQLRGKVSTEVDGELLAYEDSKLSAEMYNVGVTAVKMPSAEWLPLIKSIDVLVGEEMNPYLDSDIDCYCETDADLVRHLSYSLIERNRETAVMEVVNPSKWRVIASFSDLNELQNKVCTLWRSDSMPLVNGTDLSNLTTVINHELVSNAGLSMNGRLYEGGHKKIMRNAWDSILSWGRARVSIPCEVIVTVKLNTVHGEAVKVKREAYDSTPNQLNPLVTYPDVRAKEITVKVLSNGTIRQWTGKLSSVPEQGMACFVNEDFNEIDFETGVSFYEPTEQNIVEEVSSELIVYCNGNPFVKEQVRAVWQGEILDIALVPKTVYSSVFGRYPVYVFTTRGIYAVAYKEMGDYKDVQLIDTRRLRGNCTVATSRDKVYFVSDDDELCVISGKNVSVLSSVSSDVAQLLWLKSNEELLTRLDDDSIHVEMLSGRKYNRKERLINVYGDLYNAIAITDDGSILDLNDEIIDEADVFLETYPITVADRSLIAPLQLTVNITGNDVVQGTVELLGSDGVTCDWQVLKIIEFAGKLCHPFKSRIYARPCRLLKLRLNVTCKSDFLFRKAILDFC